LGQVVVVVVVVVVWCIRVAVVVRRRCYLPAWRSNKPPQPQ
jgi:hypothetical protein